MLTSKVLHARDDDELKEVIERWCDSDPPDGWRVSALIPARTVSIMQRISGGGGPAPNHTEYTETVTEWKVVLVR